MVVKIASMFRSLQSACLASVYESLPFSFTFQMLGIRGSFHNKKTFFTRSDVLFLHPAL